MRSKAVVLLAFLLLFAQGNFAQSASDRVPAEAQARLLRLIPNPLPAGASALEKPVFYSASTLYEYIDGAADVFQSYGVEAVFHQDFKAGAAEITADIFDMGSHENAFGMYASERSPKYDFIEIGAEGYRNEGILNFFQDRYYIKLAGFGEGADAALEQFARAISERIGSGKSFPAFLSKLPQTRRVARTEKFLRTDPLGHTFLSPAYQAVYEFEGGESILMVSVGANAAEAASKMKSLEEHFRRTGQWSRAQEFGEGAARGSNSFEGALVAAVSGNYLVMLLNPPRNSEAFFRDVVARLK